MIVIRRERNSKTLKYVGKGATYLRQSNFELLRLLCIYGIVSMHTYSVFYGTSTGVNLVYGVLINSLFNTGVSIFILISGYFGINGTIKKYIKLELEVLFYSLLSVVIISLVQNNWSLKDVIKACFPVASGEYWYITSYMLLMIFSPYVNKIPEKLEKKDFEKFLLIMFLVFSFAPTIIQFHVMNDGGKGFANMLLMYLIGRYIRLYYDTKIQIRKRLLLVGAGLIALGFAFNMLLTFFRGGKGVFAPFARDCSSIIILSSIVIFLIFKNFSFNSNIINAISKHVVAVYLFEGAIRTVFSQFFDITAMAEKWYLFALLEIYSLMVMIVCIIWDIIRGYMVKPIEDIVYLVGMKAYRLTLDAYDKYSQSMNE